MNARKFEDRFNLVCCIIAGIAILWILIATRGVN